MILYSGDSGNLSFVLSENPKEGWIDLIYDNEFFFRIFATIVSESSVDFGSYVDSDGIHWGEFEYIKYFLVFEKSILSGVKPMSYTYIVQSVALNNNRPSVVERGDLTVMTTSFYDWRSCTDSDKLFAFGDWEDVDLSFGDMNVVWDNIQSLRCYGDEV